MLHGNRQLAVEAIGAMRHDLLSAGSWRGQAPAMGIDAYLY